MIASIGAVAFVCLSPAQTAAKLLWRELCSTGCCPDFRQHCAKRVLKRQANHSAQCILFRVAARSLIIQLAYQFGVRFGQRRRYKGFSEGVRFAHGDLFGVVPTGRIAQQKRL